MGRSSYQGHSSKSKYSTVNYSPDQQYKNQMQPVSAVIYVIFEFFVLIYINLSCIFFYKQSTTPNKADFAIKSTKPVFANATTNTTSEIEPILETASSLKSNEAYNQSSSTTINSDVYDNTAGLQPIAQNNSISEGGPSTDQSYTTITTTTATSGTTVNTSTAIPENKTKVDNIVPTASKNQSTYSQPTNSQQTQCSETTVQSTTFQGPSENESNKTIDLSSLSAELEDGNLVEEKSITVINDEKSYSDCKTQSTSIILIQLIIIKLTVWHKY